MIQLDDKHKELEVISLGETSFQFLAQTPWFNEISGFADQSIEFIKCK